MNDAKGEDRERERKVFDAKKKWRRIGEEEEEEVECVELRGSAAGRRDDEEERGRADNVKMTLYSFFQVPSWHQYQLPL